MALNIILLFHLTDLWRYDNQVQSDSASTSALCLGMLGSEGTLPPTAGSCNTRLTHIRPPVAPRCAWFILAPLPPFQAPLFPAWFDSPDQGSALLLGAVKKR